MSCIFSITTDEKNEKIPVISGSFLRTIPSMPMDMFAVKW